MNSVTFPFARLLRLLAVATAWLTSVLPPSSARAAVSDVYGHYVGAWTNITFNSTGKAVIDIAPATATTATVTFDMDGFVFGFIDPPPITMPATIDGDLLRIDNHGVGIFGDIKGTIDSAKGTFSVALANIPGNFISGITADGSIVAGRMQLVYIVHFPGPASTTNPANGVMDVRAQVPLTVKAATLEGGKLRLLWTAAGGPYQVQSRSEATGGNWGNVGTPTTQTSALLDLAGDRRFFRVVVP